MTVLRRFICLFAVVFLVLGAGDAKPKKTRGIITLPSGERILIRGLSRTDQTVGGKQALTVIYYSTIPLGDTARLRAQAIEMWRSYFGIRADRATVDGAILFVKQAPPPPPPKKPKMAHFVFVRQHDGSWRIDNPGQYLGYPKDYGVALAEAAWKVQQGGEHDRAIPLYSKALEAGFLMKDQKALVLSNRCWAYNVTEADPNRAIADCAAAVALQPDLAGAHTNLATAHIRAGQYDEAHAAFASAVEHAAGNKRHQVDIYQNRAALYAEQGRHAAAMADIDKAIALSPDSALLHNTRCDLLRRKGHARRATEACDRALELALKEKDANNTGIVLFTLGLILEQRGARSQAEEAFRRAFEIAPDHPRIRARAKQIGLLR
jgi:tetratricopeptide (TPR) repeat protein